MNYDDNADDGDDADDADVSECAGEDGGDAMTRCVDAAGLSRPSSPVPTAPLPPATCL